MTLKDRVREIVRQVSSDGYGIANDDKPYYKDITVAVTKILQAVEEEYGK